MGLCPISLFWCFCGLVMVGYHQFRIFYWSKFTMSGKHFLQLLLNSFISFVFITSVLPLCFFLRTVYFSDVSKCLGNIFLVKVLIELVYFYWRDIWRLAPELKKQFFFPLCDDIMITFQVLEPKTMWSNKISFPTVTILLLNTRLATCWQLGEDHTHSVVGTLW